MRAPSGHADEMAEFVPEWSPRPGWVTAPGVVRAWTESVLGAPVLAAREVTGGFSSGLASRLSGANGDRIFVKAVHADLNPFSPRMLRRELRIGPGLAATPAAVPKLRAGLDTDGWVAAAFDEVDGTNPPWPWRAEDAARTLAALDELHRVLTPAPNIAVPPAAHALRTEVLSWTRLAGVDPADLAGLDPWLAAHRRELTEASTGIDLTGDTLLNLDVRADNIVIDAEAKVWFVDWPWACRGPATLDVVGLLINFAVAGLDPRDWLARSHVADDDLVADMLCVLAGSACSPACGEGAGRPEPPGTKGMRAFQLAHLNATIARLRQRLGS